MAIIKFEVKFPCGLEIKSSGESWYLDRMNTFDDVKECPLHGKNCKPKRRN